ncbi:uncharacterized protein [Henckelia pumila]|uniref:uncharacterized protein n=1 Tax=Henckelia pumila TaxID=405737 RepID=UPI003C6E9A09
MGKEFQKHSCIVKDLSGLINMTGERSGNTYKVNWSDQPLTTVCLVSTKMNQHWLWHKRLNHLNFKALANLSKHELVTGISQKFCAEAVNTACYTQNRSMINKKVGKTPYEIWYGKVSVISYFKVFCCKCFIHNNGKTHLTALDVRSDAGLFLGYSSVSKAYRAFNTKSLTVEESVHIVFDETPVTNESSSLNDLSNRIEESLSQMMKKIQIIQNIQYEPDQAEEQRPEEPPVDNEITTNTDHVAHHDVLNQQENSDQLGPNYRWSKNHPQKLVIGNPSAPLRTRCQMINEFIHAAFISHIEPKKVEEALLDSNWIEAMQDELNQFERNSVWHLVPRPSDKSIIGTR